MERRNCCEVIRQMIERIPTNKQKFIKDLEWNFEDAIYKPTEETIQWDRTQETLIKHIPRPKKNWEFEVISLFTTRAVEDIRADF